MHITIYGSGCAKCKQTETLIRNYVTEARIAAQIEHIADPRAIVAAGVLLTPAVSIDGVIKLSGRVPRRQEVEGWLR